MSHPVSIHITAFYHFVPLEEEALTVLREELFAFGVQRGMRGLTLLAPEGINGTVCGSPDAIAGWKELLSGHFAGITFKDSTADRTVFKRWSVKRRLEIIGLKRPDIRPDGKRRHLSPKEWEEMLQQEDVMLIDTRNAYEYEIGRFRGAVNPGIRTFQEFPAYVQHAGIPKDTKVLMYCTGGSRCEKALIAMEEQGYDNVYQLEGGILAYLEQFPGANFEGECFVFDERVAVDQALCPSAVYDICPHCGLPGDRPIDCARCGKAQKICASCAPAPYLSTCSKRCANELRFAPAR